MSLEHKEADASDESSSDAQPSNNDLPTEQTPPLSDANLQEEYRKAYLEQQKRRSCPGCGEDASFF